VIRLAVVRDDEALAGGEPPPGLLSAREQVTFASLASAARRHKWLLGRVAAKRAVAAALAELGRPAPPPAELIVANEPAGAPYVVGADGSRLPLPISISHRAGVGLCAVSLDPDLVVGADLELVEPRDDALVRQFFDDEEAAAIAGARGRARTFLVARTWSAKEAVLKVIGLGLRLDTRTVAVRDAGAGAAGPPFPAGFVPLAVRLAGEEMPCAFRDDGAWVIVLAARRRPPAP